VFARAQAPIVSAAYVLHWLDVRTFIAHWPLVRSVQPKSDTSAVATAAAVAPPPAVGDSRVVARRQNLLGQEAAYNLGRAYQQLNLVHLAVPYYEHALRLATAQKRRTATRSDRSGGGAGGGASCATARTVGLEREAAYNLFLIYRAHKGSERLAREILRRHLTI